MDESRERREFIVLEVQCSSEACRDCFMDVQDAVDSRLGMHMISTERMEIACPSCGSRVNQGEVHKVAEPPDVFCVQVLSWGNVRLLDGRWTMQRICNDMCAKGN